MDTRIAKLHSGEADALILAYAGLSRLGRKDESTEILPPETCLPQVGQACVAVQCRADDEEAIRLIRTTCDHLSTRREVECERAFLALLGGGCTAPVAGFAFGDESNLSLFALVASPDGAAILRTRAVSTWDNGAGIARTAYDDLIQRGAMELLGIDPQ